ncbi:hypothetical protein J4H86_16060 [Spiractinospora alimapuensis]|uniref:hypothetical protein n=1 Tax=Spiractinospora alimapuensis TaxID=2820884 RepID=UPI001F3FE03E|nr:hypothetical protein [Spiractinospora alimapuensis]QVQ50436.1 hypothetical protein J4H86_16060 [Spiractinospora alimapuensis]
MAGKGPLRHAPTVLLCAGLLALIGVAQHLEISFTDRTAPIATSGSPEEPVDTGTFTLTVDDVRLAAAVADASDLPEETDADAGVDPGTDPDGDGEDGAVDDGLDPAALDDDGAGLLGDGGAPLEAEGLWVVVDLTVTATDRGLTVDTPALLDVADGLSYGSVGLDYTMENYQISPGIPASGSLAFEVPQERLEDPTLRFVAGGIDSRLAGEAKVDLGLEESDLDAMTNDPVEVAPISAPATS